MSFMMSTEDAILFSASELPQYAITNVNVSKLRKWLGLADCFAVCLLCNYQHSLQTGMSNFSSSQQADFNDGIMGWVKLTGTGEWNGCPSVMNKCNKHRARQDKKKKKKEWKQDLFSMWALDLSCSQRSWKHGALVGFPRVLFNHVHAAFFSEQTEGERETQETVKLKIWSRKIYAREKAFKQSQ